MSLRPAKVHEQGIAEKMSNMAVEALYHVGTGLLIGSYHLPQILRVEMYRQ
jgi:hypothetical protein